MRRIMFVMVGSLMIAATIVAAQTDALPTLQYPATASLKWRYKPAANSPDSFILRLDTFAEDGTIRTGQDVFGGWAEGPEDAEGYHPYTQPLNRVGPGSEDLPNGHYRINVKACAPLGCGPFVSADFLVVRAATPPPPTTCPPNCPPPSTSPMVIEITFIDGTPPSPAAQSTARAAARPLTVPTPTLKGATFNVPFSLLGSVTFCPVDATGTLQCHTADWWLGLIPSAAKP